MAYQFTCPYCFRTMRDDEVLFRSEKVTSGRPAPSATSSDAAKMVEKLLPGATPVNTDEERELLTYVRAALRDLLERGDDVTKEDLYPEDEYDSWRDFQNRFPDCALKTRIGQLDKQVRELRDAARKPFSSAADDLSAFADTRNGVPVDDGFFDLSADPVYERFWRKFAGGRTTESDTEHDREPWRRRILDPRNKVHQSYLQVQPDGGYFIRDADGMVAKIQLKEDALECDRRVCPHCHNPLPPNYGKNPVRRLAVIGITGSGKTVYLCRLFENMDKYMAKVRLNAFDSPGVTQFLYDNEVAYGKPLPGSTAVYLHQPLFFDLSRAADSDHKRVETLVIYDVTGEVFEDPRRARDALQFAPFIRYADGIMLLIDPAQFPSYVGAKAGRELRYKPSQALRNIHNIVTDGDTRRKCRKPVAVCLSKMDEMMNLFPDELRRRLSEEVEGIRDKRGYYEPMFNAKAYNPIFDGLYTFFQTHDEPLSLLMDGNFKNYACFAFTALGCDVDKDTGLPVNPDDRFTSRRIEEPLLWLFHCFGYIDTNEKIDYPYKRVICPECGGSDNYPLPLAEREIRYGFLRLNRRYVNRCCNECGNRWFDETADEDERNELEELRIEREREWARTQADEEES